jgi:hypothetical protein
VSVSCGPALNDALRPFGVLPLSNDKTLATTVEHTPMTFHAEIPPCLLNEMLSMLFLPLVSYAITSSTPSSRPPVHFATI